MVYHLYPHEPLILLLWMLGSIGPSSSSPHPFICIYPVSCYLASNILSRKKPINFLTLQHFHVFYQGVSGSVCHACNDTLAVTEWHGD